MAKRKYSKTFYVKRHKTKIVQRDWMYFFSSRIAKGEFYTFCTREFCRRFGVSRKELPIGEKRPVKITIEFLE